MTVPHPVVLLWVAVLGAVGCQPLQFVVTVGPVREGLDESTVLEEAGAGAKVAIVDVSGMILNAERSRLLQQGENPVGLLHEQLGKAAEDDDVRAVLLRINSPGGGVTASQAMFEEVDRFRDRTGKPVVALLMDVAASGGFYLACAADAVVAYPTTVTGSVGVIIQTVGFGPALARFGVQAEAITSGPNKDAGNPLGALDDEERATLQAVVDDFFVQFVKVVRERRPGLTGEALDRAIDGRIVSGTRALELGLVDELGSVYDAWRYAKRAAGIERADLVRYHRPMSRVNSPYALASGGGAAGHAAAAPGETGVRVELIPESVDLPPGFYYLWRPGFQ